MNRESGAKHEQKRKSECAKSGIGSFWTICPYCYHLYEYEIVYLDCCLRCQNCEKAFHGAAIEGPLPKIRAVEGKELYDVRLGLFKICYSFKEVDCCKTHVGCGTDQVQDLVDVDAGSNNIQRRRVIANHESTSGRMNANGFCEDLKEKFGAVEKDEGELSKTGLIADHLENGINREYEQNLESKSGVLEFYIDDDDIYVGLADLI